MKIFIHEEVHGSSEYRWSLLEAMTRCGQWTLDRRPPGSNYVASAPTNKCLVVAAGPRLIQYVDTLWFAVTTGIPDQQIAIGCMYTGTEATIYRALI